MKTAKEFGPWTMSAHGCHMNTFWRKRVVALQRGNARQNRTSRRHGVCLLVLLALMIVMPSWQLGEQSATAEEQGITKPTNARLPQGRELPAVPQVLDSVPHLPFAANPRPWQLIDSPQLPTSNKIVLVEGKHVYVDMPAGGKLAKHAGDGIFTAVLIDSTGDILIRALKSGVGKLTFEKGEHKKVEIQVVVVSNPDPLKKKLDQSGLGHIIVTPGVQSVTLSGTLTTSDQLKRCIGLADPLYPHVVNNIRIGKQQVQLNCRIFEFTVDEPGLNGALGKLFRGGEQESHSKGIYFSLLDGEAFSTRFEELRETVDAKMIAEPVLVTVSGRPAAFNAGGEFPILVPQGLGTVAVEYKTFGTRVDFVPSVLEDHRIRLEVRPQLTQLMQDEKRAVEIGGKTIPALKSRWVDVAAEMTSKQALIAVLVHENQKGRKVGFVTMVRPTLVSATAPDGVAESETPVREVEKADAAYSKLR